MTGRKEKAMRLFTDKAIIAARETAGEMFQKLVTYRPDDKLTRGDIEKLMFIVRQYDEELKSIAFNRAKARREADRKAAKELTEAEKDLLDRLTLNAIANGNTVSPEAFDPTPDEYAALHSIRIKMNLNN